MSSPARTQPVVPALTSLRSRQLVDDAHELRARPGVDAHRDRAISETFSPVPERQNSSTPRRGANGSPCPDLPVGADFPCPETERRLMTYRPRPEFIFVSEEEMPVHRAAELIAELTRRYDSEYVLLLSQAVESGSRNDQASYKSFLDAAIGALAHGGRGRGTATELVFDHLGRFFAVFGADPQKSGHRDVDPDLPPQGP
jgi:hypothetical protein